MLNFRSKLILQNMKFCTLYTVPNNLQNRDPLNFYYVVFVYIVSEIVDCRKRLTILDETKKDHLMMKRQELSIFIVDILLETE